MVWVLACLIDLFSNLLISSGQSSVVSFGRWPPTLWHPSFSELCLVIWRILALSAFLLKPFGYLDVFWAVCDLENLRWNHHPPLPVKKEPYLYTWYCSICCATNYAMRVWCRVRFSNKTKWHVSCFTMKLFVCQSSIMKIWLHCL